jgi:uridine kinase
MGALSTLHETPIWDLYVQGLEAQAVIESELAKTLAAEGTGRAQVLAQWMQTVTDGKERHIEQTLQGCC